MKLSLFTESNLVGSFFADDCFELLNNLREIIIECNSRFIPKGLDASTSVIVNGPEDAIVHPSAVIEGPVFINCGAIVRSHAYIRGPAYIGANCVVGHSTEIKNSILLPGAKAPHFNYIGDSILCENVNLGAGTKIANVRLDKKNVGVLVPQKEDDGFTWVPDSDHYLYSLTDTGRKKFGAILADDSQTGCNAVLSPGTILMHGASVGPCEHFKGTKK